MTATPRHLREGVIAGLIGATIVAVWFLIYDAARGAPFRTPTLLGSAALQGVQNPEVVPVSTGLVVQYTVLHGVVFALVGILIAFLIVSAQRQPARLLMLVIALLCFEVFFLAVVVWLARPVLHDVAWWAILVANVLAAGGMLAYFFVGHRALGRALLGPWTRVAQEGFVAGALGAAAVAVWFLLYDTAAGAPGRGSPRGAARSRGAHHLAAADPEIHSRPRGGLRGLRLAGGRASGAGGSRAAAPVRVHHAVRLFRGILLCDDRGSRPLGPGGARLVDDPGGEPAGGAGHARLPAPRAPRRLARVPLGAMIGESLSPTPRQGGGDPAPAGAR